MPTSAQRLRTRIQDPLRIADVVSYGDGTASTFALGNSNVSDGTAFVPGPGGWSATGATFDSTGFVVFATAISANSAYRVRYVHHIFSEAEINDWLDSGNLNTAAKQAVIALMFDGLKRAKWSAPDGTSYDDTAALAQLRQLYDILDEEDESVWVASGSTGSWSLDQEAW